MNYIWVETRLNNAISLGVKKALVTGANGFVGRHLCKELLHQGLGSLQVDSGKIRRELGWTLPFTLEQGLQATADWHRSVIH